MKRYKLLKGIPEVEAGAIFTLTEMMVDNTEGEVMLHRKYSDFFEEERSIIIPKRDILDFEKWFEPYEAKYFYHVDHWLGVERKEIRPTGFGLSGPEGRSNLKAVGNYFETQEEAEKHLEWLKARAVLVQDAKGFTPDWKDSRQKKWYVEYYNEFGSDKFFIYANSHCQVSRVIYFKSKEDAEVSIKNHTEEWKIYLGVE